MSGRDVRVVHPFLLDVGVSHGAGPTGRLRNLAEALGGDHLVACIDADTAADGDGTLFDAHYAFLDYDVVLRGRAHEPGAPDNAPSLGEVEQRGDPGGAEEYLADIRARLRERAEQVPLYGLVLAGGRSERMGRPKWGIDYHGAPQVSVLHELLSRHCEQVYVSVREDQLGEPLLADLPHIVDAFRGLGPLGGILTAMSERPHAAWLVLACDLPGVTDGTIERLLAARAPLKFATAYRSPVDGLPEPLIAIYEPKARLRLFQTAGLGYRCPRKMLINSRCEVISGADTLELANVNSPDEYERALGHLRARGVG